MEANTKMRDMTQGSPAKHIFLFSLPLLLGNVLQQLYNMVDSWTVGNFTGDTALAAVGIAFPVVFLFVSLFIGLGIGSTVVIAQFYGAGETERVRAAIDTAYAAFLIVAIPRWQLTNQSTSSIVACASDSVSLASVSMSEYID